MSSERCHDLCFFSKGQRLRYTREIGCFDFVEVMITTQDYGDQTVGGFGRVLLRFDYECFYTLSGGQTQQFGDGGNCPLCWRSHLLEQLNWLCTLLWRSCNGFL